MCIKLCCLRRHNADDANWDAGYCGFDTDQNLLMGMQVLSGAYAASIPDLMLA